MRARALALGGGRERRLRDLVGAEAELLRPAQRLGDDAGEGVRAAPDRRPVHDPGARAVAPDDVARVGEPPVDRADRVGVHAQRGAQVPHRREAGAGLEPAGLDLVGELPVDLGGDRDVRAALDVELGRVLGPARGQPFDAYGYAFVLLDIVD